MKILHSNLIGNSERELFIIHGFLGMGDNWKTHAKKIAENNFRVHLIDLRNHGKSFWSNEFNFDLMIDDIYNYAKHHDIKKFSLLGHSMGGNLTMLFAQKFPQLLDKIIIVFLIFILFYIFLKLLDETGYFNASLYSPYGIRGIETLGHEIANEVMALEGKYPEAVVVTNAGGGNLTGTARGLKDAGAINTEVIAASVALYGLHMASDNDFNKKSFTTGHTGFGIPFSTYPDRSDVPRSAARPMRYMDRYVTVNQGSVFFMTEALARLEGMERGPAGNTSLAAAFSLAQEMDKDAIIVVQETEYTGAGKHILPQLSFAKRNGIQLLFGNPQEEEPGKNIIFPKNGSYLKHTELQMDDLRKSYLKRYKDKELNLADFQYLSDELKIGIKHIKELLK